MFRNGRKNIVASSLICWNTPLFDMTKIYRDEAFLFHHVVLRKSNSSWHDFKSPQHFEESCMGRDAFNLLHMLDLWGKAEVSPVGWKGRRKGVINKLN